MKITSDILREWSACKDGYKVFCELMPNGATLQQAIKKLDDDWSLWLFKKCQYDERFKN